MWQWWGCLPTPRPCECQRTFWSAGSRLFGINLFCLLLPLSVSLWNFVSDSQLPAGVLAFTEALYQVWLCMGPGDLNSSLPTSIASVCPPSYLPRPKFLIFIKWLWLKLLAWGKILVMYTIFSHVPSLVFFLVSSVRRLGKPNVNPGQMKVFFFFFFLVYLPTSPSNWEKHIMECA